MTYTTVIKHALL